MTLTTLAEWLLLVGCCCACFMQFVALKSPDVRDSPVACALRRIKVCTWVLFGGFVGYLLFMAGGLPIHVFALIALLALAFCDAAWPLISLFEPVSTDPRMTQPAPLYDTGPDTFDDRPHHHH
jgi:hypothetical protein